VRQANGYGTHAVEQALLVAASTFPAPRPACGLIAAAVQQRVVSAGAVIDALAVAVRQRHRRVLRAAAYDIAQGSNALSEIDFMALCRRFRLPPPIQQAVRREPSGRRRYLTHLGGAPMGGSSWSKWTARCTCPSAVGGTTN
jgi:hypothetical protein